MDYTMANDVQDVLGIIEYNKMLDLVQPLLKEYYNNPKFSLDNVKAMNKEHLELFVSLTPSAESLWVVHRNRLDLFDEEIYETIFSTFPSYYLNRLMMNSTILHNEKWFDKYLEKNPGSSGIAFILEKPEGKVFCTPVYFKKILTYLESIHVSDLDRFMSIDSFYVWYSNL
jgi:hypothetical protein